VESLRRKYRKRRKIGETVLLVISCCLICGGRAGAQDPYSPPATPQPQSSPPNQSPDHPAGNSTWQTQAPQDQNPQNQNPPAEKKDDNPAQAIEQKTKQVTVQAAEATKKVGEQALVRARDWEASWITGVYVEQQQTRVPLSGEERRQIYLRQTLTTPGAYMKRMFQAGFDQARGVPSQWDDGWGGYAERFASREGQFISANTLAALGNAALKYEVRYDQCRCSGFVQRTRHAVVRNFLTYNEQGAWRPQWALYGGAFGGGAISTAWKPHPRDVLANGGLAVLGQAGYGALLNFVIEFARDVNGKLGAKK
jgi:hypothetical protein